MPEKNKRNSGADERTPSKSEYFSWINSTNEGSNEAQTLANLAFFRYLKETYGMQLDIYAWDAGNLDGAGGGYETPDSEKLRAQYPNGYEPIVKAAAEMGTRMGVWGGADGYGDTEEEANARRDILVKLCKDYHFALFKFDTVCGELRAEKRKEFEKSMRECRKYSPDLILLNHRNDLGEAEYCATTFLWEGQETYVDVHGFNTVTAPHNRAYTFFRGHTPELKRLTEDHGVCISSSIDYFEDDLVYQAFNRSLILAPEIYGNPWFMRDDELPTLARIYNLHRRHREILIDGMLPPAELGDLGNNAVFRGDGKRRFFVSGNASWQEKTVRIPLNEKIGLSPCKEVCVTRRFPTELFSGCFAYGDTVELTIPPFRAVLFEICDVNVADLQWKGGEYRVIKESETGEIQEVELLSKTESFGLFDVKTKSFISLAASDTDMRLQNPVKLCSLHTCPVPANAETLYETVCFGADNDSLERRSIRRSGESTIPEVRAAREAFFSQSSYHQRGCETASPFDGNPKSIFDVKSRAYYNFNDRIGYRIEDGCLRVDLGNEEKIERIEIEYFDANCQPKHLFFPQIPTEYGEVSKDLQTWNCAPLSKTETLQKETLLTYAYYSDVPIEAQGERKKAVYATGEESFRYFRLNHPIDRIFSIRFFFGEEEIKAKAPHLTNLFAPYEKRQTKFSACGTVRLTKENLPIHPYLAVAFEGKTGYEAAYCCAEVDGKLFAFPSRAPAYPAHAYEYPVHPVDGNYTYFLPIKSEWVGKEIKLHAMFAERAVPVDVYLCDGKHARQGKTVSVK